MAGDCAGEDRDRGKGENAGRQEVPCEDVVAPVRACRTSAAAVIATILPLGMRASIAPASTLPSTPLMAKKS